MSGLITRPVALPRAAGNTAGDVAEAMNHDRSTVSHWSTGRQPAPPELFDTIQEFTNPTTGMLIASVVAEVAT